MTTDQRTDAVDHTEALALPAQRRPAESATRRIDHVRAHGRSCWWDHVQCRWQCSPER